VSRARVIVGRALAIAVLAIALLYVCDSLYLRFILGGANSAAALGSVQYYPAAQQKNGTVQIYFESPQSETCVHAFFPHYGYNPCWYAKRKTVRLMGRRSSADKITMATRILEINPSTQAPTMAPERLNFVVGHQFECREEEKCESTSRLQPY
jgi:hypothetical protein